MSRCKARDVTLLMTEKVTIHICYDSEADMFKKIREIKNEMEQGKIHGWTEVEVIDMSAPVEADPIGYDM